MASLEPVSLKEKTERQNFVDKERPNLQSIALVLLNFDQIRSLFLCSLLLQVQ